MIGRQGWTGNVVPPGPGGSHLHYEIRSKCKPFFGWLTNVDPLQYLEHFYVEGDDYMLNPDDANKIIALLGAVWQVTDTPNSTNEGQNEAGRLANALREASGQSKK